MLWLRRRRSFRGSVVFWADWRSEKFHRANKRIVAAGNSSKQIRRQRKCHSDRLANCRKIRIPPLKTAKIRNKIILRRKVALSKKLAELAKARRLLKIPKTLKIQPHQTNLHFNSSNSEEFLFKVVLKSIAVKLFYKHNERNL